MTRSRFVEVPRETFFLALEAAGFVVSNINRTGEVIYELAHKINPELVVRVYTSVPHTASNARACGEDAIRVGLFWSTSSMERGLPLFWATKVLRTGTVEKVIERTLERARESYKMANVTVRLGSCSKCGAPVYTDSKRCVVRECREHGGRAA